MIKSFVATDIAGRISDDMDTVLAVVEWMNAKNPNSGDCVVWEKIYKDEPLKKNLIGVKIAACRVDGKWNFSS